MSTRIHIDIVGPRPNEVDIEDLSRILDDLRRAITACLPAELSPSPVEGLSRVSLVDIVDGSDGLIMELQSRAAASMATLSRALRRRRYSDLPTAAHAALFRVNQLTAKRKWGVRIRRNESIAVEAVEITEPDHVTPPTDRRVISGGTELLARCLRVGGATVPRAELRLSNHRLLHVEVTELVARELGKRLYDEIVLSGVAEWDATDGEIRAFKVEAVTAFRSVPVDVAFKELAAASNGRWEGIDAESFVRGIREATD
jgi:hypothetical protein